MVPVALSDVIAVGEVPTAEEIAILARAGFRSLLNTQPDGEVERLLTSAEAGRLASASGLEYLHLPIESRRPSDAAVAQFAEALARLPRPVYACCYSGARSAAVWARAAAPAVGTDAVVEACRAAGYDISFMRGELDLVAAGVPAQATAEPAKPTAHRQASEAPREALPRLVPSVLIPRAASAGGFAVSG
jgi:sulfide:quinone oxidoreductase